MIAKAQACEISPNNLKRAFESAVRDIHEVSLTGKPSQHRTPIVQRPRVSGSPVNEEKRALADAARALAQLWKISPHPAR
jgi:hypothetical protein